MRGDFVVGEMSVAGINIFPFESPSPVTGAKHCLLVIKLSCQNAVAKMALFDCCLFILFSIM